MIEIPKNIKRKINKMKKLRDEATQLESHIHIWLEKNNIDTKSDLFTYNMLGTISYVEFKDAKDFEEKLNEYLESDQK